MFTKKNYFSLFIFLLVLFIPFLAFSQANLEGRYVKIDGPFCWGYLGVARTNYAYRLMEKALGDSDMTRFRAVLKNYDIAVIEKNTPVVVLDVEILEGRARVTVLEGLQQGATGWIPLDWVESSYQKAKFWH